MSWQTLLKSTSPVEHVWSGNAAVAQDDLRLLGADAGTACAVRFLRGPKCADRAGFFDEAAAALQFPVHFGENWDAFRDCFGDLAPHATTVVVCILEANIFLDSPKDSVAHFRAVVRETAADWAKSVIHAHRALRVVYQAEAEAVLTAKYPGAVKLS